MIDLEDYDIAPKVSRKVERLVLCIDYADGSAADIVLSEENVENITDILKVMALYLQMADYPYVKTLTANCTDGIQHTGR